MSDINFFNKTLKRILSAINIKEYSFVVNSKDSNGELLKPFYSNDIEEVYNYIKKIYDYNFDSNNKIEVYWVGCLKGNKKVFEVAYSATKDYLIKDYLFINIIDLAYSTVKVKLEEEFDLVIYKKIGEPYKEWRNNYA